MADKNQNGKNIARFSLAGLIVFSVALVFTGALLTFALSTAANSRITHNFFSHHSGTAGTAPGGTPPWGEFTTADIQLEQPEEYLAYELQNVKAPVWVFEKQSPDEARNVLTTCGVPAKQIERALSPTMSSSISGNTVVRPDDELVLSLAPEARTKLYRELAHGDANHYMKFPFIYPGKSYETCFDDGVMPETVAPLVKKLLYARGEAMCFSDFEIVMRHLTTETDKLKLLRALSRQSAVLVRLRVRPETDVDKVIGYWNRGADVKSVRPLLESMTRIPDGSTLSLLYLLPQFARQRLYTFPAPSNAGDPVMDCHWSTMNFFNATPDNHFTVPSYTVSFLKTNCYPIAKPTAYGDIVLFLDENGNAIHSAIYLADDIVFTKNGNNFAQPWMLMRLKDLTARYELDSPSKLLIYRQKNS
jgi:hypothetical protein